MGSYSFKGGTKVDTYNYGVELTSRPKQVSFDYKYDSYNSDKFKVWASVENRSNNIVTQLAYGEIAAGTASSDYTTTVFDLIYDAKYKHLKATHFSLVFSSTNKCNDTHSVESSAIDNANLLRVVNSSYWGGSVLCIDNIQLIY